MTSVALAIVAVVLAILGGVVGWAYLRARAVGPAVYRNLSLTDLEPFLRSWGAWLGNRGEILVRHEGAEPTVHFRKCTYKRRRNVLLFRYRNADESRRTFSVVRAALEGARVGYEVELTRRTRQPRAFVVALDPSDVWMPTAAMRLIDTVFRALQVDTTSGFLVWSQGRFQAKSDRENVPLIAPTDAQRAGFRMGVALRRLVRGILLLLAIYGGAVMAEDRTTGVAADDPEMIATINNARMTVKQFFDAFMNPKKGQTSFLLKVAFVSGDQTEHIWLADLDFSGPKPRGVVANEPQIKGVRFKQTVDFDPAHVTDWMYVDNWRLVGGYTTRLLRERMTPDERKQLDARVPYRF